METKVQHSILPGWSVRPSEQVAIWILVILYVVGIAGVLIPIHPEFMRLTPFNLLVSLFILLWFHPAWNSKTWLFLAISYIVGFLVELYGVQTGRLFGHYEYGLVLGPKLWKTPLMIGINWVLVTFAAAATINRIIPGAHVVAKAIVAAAAMTGLDVLIEPDAMQYGLWSWENNYVPFQNYAGWFMVSLALQLLYAHWFSSVQNRVGVALFILQLLFFAVI